MIRRNRSCLAAASAFFILALVGFGDARGQTARLSQANARLLAKRAAKLKPGDSRTTRLNSASYQISRGRSRVFVTENHGKRSTTLHSFHAPTGKPSSQQPVLDVKMFHNGQIGREGALTLAFDGKLIRRTRTRNANTGSEVLVTTQQKRDAKGRFMPATLENVVVRNKNAGFADIFPGSSTALVRGAWSYTSHENARDTLKTIAGELWETGHGGLVAELERSLPKYAERRVFESGHIRKNVVLTKVTSLPKGGEKRLDRQELSVPGRPGLVTLGSSTVIGNRYGKSGRPSLVRAAPIRKQLK